MLEGVAPSLDHLRQKIRDYDILRDPLRCPAEDDFLRDILVLKTENIGDGNSRVFLSVGPDGDKYDQLRPGMVLIDFRGFRFNICAIVSSARAGDVSDPPIDPVTGETISKHIVVENIGQASTEFIPFASGVFVSRADPDPTPAVGSMVALPFTSIIEGDTFVLFDGINPTVTFEFDTDFIVIGSNIPVDISADITDVDVATTMVAVINSAPLLGLSADNAGGSSATVTITNTIAGTKGNDPAPPSYWSSSNGGIVITQPSGGAAGDFINDPADVDDGFNPPPYAFTVANTPMVRNRVTVEWKDGVGDEKSGFFQNDGVAGGDLAETSTIDFDAGVVSIDTEDQTPIEADSIRVSYTYEYPVATPIDTQEDGEIRAQNILAFLASDYGITLDRNDPTVLQRSYVYNAYQLWGIKGTELGYEILGKTAGYFVDAAPLHKVSEAIAGELDQTQVFQFPPGTKSSGSIVAVAAADFFDGETFTLDDGVNSSKVFEFDTIPDGVTGGNELVDISADTTAIDVATRMVLAINGAAPLDLSASNEGGTSATVTIGNLNTGAQGNVTTWLTTVADSGFLVTQPTGGTTGEFFTTVVPRRVLFDEVVVDALPVDLLCGESEFPDVLQAVTVDSAEVVEFQGSRKRTLVKVTVGASTGWTTAFTYSAGQSVTNGPSSFVCILSHVSDGTNEPGVGVSWATYWVASGGVEDSYFTFGLLADTAGIPFVINDPVRTSATTYEFEVVNFAVPTVGSGSVRWEVLKVDLAIAPSEITDLGVQFAGFTGRRYRIETFVTDPIVADIGNWKFIDAAGNISHIELWEHVSGGCYRMEVISDVPPVDGPARFFYACEIVTDCNFCRASSILVRISPTSILLFPEALEGDSLERLIIRLTQMIPAHVRIAAFVFDPGPALAAWGPITASTFSADSSPSTAYFVPSFDIPGFPADSTPLDSSPIVATSTSTITNENVFEEYLAGLDPIVSGAWTATGLWHVTEYRSSTQFRSFNYGQGDVGQLGGVGAVAPNYDETATGGSGVLESPAIPAVAAVVGQAVTLRFRHFADMRADPADIVEVRVVEDTGSSTVRTISSVDLGISVSGTTGGSFVTVSFDIKADVEGVGAFHLEFDFDSAGSSSGVGGECWYIDDVEVQVTPP